MKKARRRYDRAFKISVVAELDDGNPPAQIARKHGLNSRLGRFSVVDFGLLQISLAVQLG